MKQDAGQFFEDLDLVTTLVQPKPSLLAALGDDRKYVALGVCVTGLCEQLMAWPSDLQTHHRCCSADRSD